MKDSFEKNDCNNCSEHGICINRTTCYCDSRFEGVYCELQIFDLKRIECNLKCYGSCLENNKQNIAYECFGECLKKNCLNVSKNFKGDQNNNINGVENKIGRHEEKENNKDYLEFSSESF